MKMSEEDYLKQIYKESLKNDGDYVSTGILSHIFGYRVQSIIEMLKHMEKKNLLTYKPYKGVKLTPSGSDKAMMLVSSHRLWEYFLSEHLGLDDTLIHENAEVLEHATSHELLVKLYDYLGQPKYCPHGQVIPKIK